MKRIFWKEEHYDKIVEVLHRNHPIIIESSETLAGIKIEDVNLAMRMALPASLCRPNLTMTLIREPLMKAVERFRMHLIINSRQPSFQAPPPPPPKPTADQFLEFIIDLVSDKVADKLADRLLSRIPTMMLVQPSEKAPAEPTYPITDRRRPTSEKIKVGIVGLLSIQAHELESRFSTANVEFVFVIEKGTRGVQESMAGCDVIFCLVSKSSHAVDGVLARNFKEKYHRVNGGITSMIHAVHAWIAMNVPKAEA